MLLLLIYSIDLIYQIIIVFNTVIIFDWHNYFFFNHCAANTKLFFECGISEGKTFKKRRREEDVLKEGQKKKAKLEEAQPTVVLNEQNESASNKACDNNDGKIVLFLLHFELFHLIFHRRLIAS